MIRRRRGRPRKFSSEKRFPQAAFGLSNLPIGYNASRNMTRHADQCLGFV
jgi:hypothetical protein